MTKENVCKRDGKVAGSVIQWEKHLEVSAMFRNLFRPDSPLMVTMTQITDCVFLSLFWILGCVPGITAGASCAALYDSVYRGFRQGDRHPWQRFLHTFRGSWKSGMLPTAVFLVLSAGLVRGVIAVWNAAVYGMASWAFFAAVAFLGVTALGILSVVFPVLSRFENSFLGLMKNTLLLALANLPRTIALGMLNACAGLLCLRYVYPLFFLPALAALISTALLEPMFRPYLQVEA